MKTGTVKNVAAFEKLVGICNDLGARYNPSKATLTPTALATLLEQAQQKLEAVNSAGAIYTLAVNNRQEKYAGIHALVGRVIRALAAAEASDRNIEDGKRLKRWLLSRSRPKVSEVSTEEGGKKNYSLSKLDFNSKASTFAKLIDLLNGCALYKPNEPDLTVHALRDYLEQLYQSTALVAQAERNLASARIERDKLMLGKGGFFETANAVKEYIRSLEGVRSTIALEVGKLRLSA